MSPLPPRPLLDGAFHLRPLAPGDVDAWFALLTDPRVYGPTSWNITRPEQVEAMIARQRSLGLRQAVARAEDDRLVGTLGATRWEVDAGVAEVAYELAPAVWGRGLATLAVCAFLDAAARAGLRRVEAHTWTGNAPSAAVLRRTGFVAEALLPAFRDCRGELRDFWRWAREVSPDQQPPGWASSQAS